MVNHYQLPVAPTIPMSAYLAGLIDGDGSIMIRRRDKKKTLGDRQRGISFMLIVAIGGETSHLTDLRKEWGLIGSFWVRKRENQRHLAEWKIANNNARRLLEAVEPFLKLKRPQALTALTLPSPRSRWGVTKELREQQELCRVQVSALNKRNGRGKVVEYGG